MTVQVCIEWKAARSDVVARLRPQPVEPRCHASGGRSDSRSFGESSSAVARGRSSTETAETQTTTEASPATGPFRIVVVDDHNIVREGLKLLLATQSDFIVLGEAEDGEHAIRQVRALRPDVVIMDVTMPRLNGIEATRIIKNEFPDVRVIGLSMHESQEMFSAMRKAGVWAYLPKGGPSDALFAAIRGDM